MKFKVDEIAAILEREISSFDGKLETAQVGKVIEVGDGIAHIYGLKNAMAGEMLLFPNNIYGQVFNLEEETVGAVVLGDYFQIKEGDLVRSTGQLLSVPVGRQLLGRVVNPLGQAIDGGPPIQATETRKVDIIAPGIADRQPVKEPLQTGIKAIDTMIPIGRGQRELIIGDRKTGKTAIAIDTIINQKKFFGTPDEVICVYVAIGQKESTVAGVVDMLKRAGAMDYTIVVNAGASDAAPLQYIAPYSGCAMAEYFMWQGKATLCVYDDLSKQAQAYRQLSLLLRRPPGREAYPGDVFYLHSRLLERACKLSKENGGGSLTALPVIETQEGEVSAYIPTNVISITDGQIYLEPDLFYAGVRPAVNVGISVSRVGGSAQVKAMKHKKVAASLRLDLAAYRALEAFTQIGTELDASTQKQLDRGARMVELLKQPQYQPMEVVDQVAVIYAGTQGLLDQVQLRDVSQWERDFLDYFASTGAAVRDEISTKKELTAELEAKLLATIKAFCSGSPLVKKVLDMNAPVAA
ncbi:MAG: F0F1 ATP synthase subunit alpha [Phycisphaerales bacterium]|nr:F0F1 ATP synthase subunit alpha [Phycisphaerales bacterium]